MHTPTFSTLLAPCSAALSGFARIRSVRGGIMKIKLTKRVTMALIAALAISPVWAQRAPIVVDGQLWLSSTPEVRKAFLVGAGNMIAMETAYSKKKGTPPPVAGAMADKALQALTLDEISNRITRWYEGNPGRRNMPVMGVIWIDMVDRGAGGK
jgi:hypothetical protein